MKNKEKGFGIVETLLVIVLLGLIGTVSWLVYERQQERNAANANTPQQTNQTDQVNKTTGETNEELSYNTVDGVNYSIPAGWKNVIEPRAPYEAGEGNYLISPDYIEKDLGQLFIEAGGYIHFAVLDWVGIDAKTSIEQAANRLKTQENTAYYDATSVRVTKIGDKQVVIYDGGHTTDGVNIMHKNSDNKWLEAGFTTVGGGDAEYNAQDSEHYQTFLDWLEDFIELNP